MADAADAPSSAKQQQKHRQKAAAQPQGSGGLLSLLTSVDLWAVLGSLALLLAIFLFEQLASTAKRPPGQQAQQYDYD